MTTYLTRFDKRPFYTPGWYELYLNDGYEEPYATAVRIRHLPDFTILVQTTISTDAFHDGSHLTTVVVTDTASLFFSDDSSEYFFEDYANAPCPPDATDDTPCDELSRVTYAIDCKIDELTRRPDDHWRRLVMEASL